MKSFAAVAVWLALLGPASAENEPHLIGVGAKPGGCAEWAAEPQNSVLDFVYSGWVMGYVSAFNVWSNPRSGLDLTGDLPNASATAWAKNYCRNHPLDQVGTAALRLIEELQRRQH